MLGCNSVWASHTSAYLAGRGTGGLSFQGCLYSEQPWKMEVVPPAGAEDKLSYCSV